MTRTWLRRTTNGLAIAVLACLWAATFMRARARPELSPGNLTDVVHPGPAALSTNRAPARVRRSSPARRWAGHALLGLLAVTWLVLLRPQSLGGSAVYVIVRGDSMLPTYDYGDLLLISAQPTYSIGDPVAYRVPQSEPGAGKLVVHRIVAQADHGYVMRGDNNPAEDPWRPTPDLVVGRVMLAVPKVGQVIGLALQPTTAGALGAAVVVMLLLARGGSVAKPGKAHHTRTLAPV